MYLDEPPTLFSISGPAHFQLQHPSTPHNTLYLPSLHNTYCLRIFPKSKIAYRKIKLILYNFFFLNLFFKYIALTFEKVYNTFLSDRIFLLGKLTIAWAGEIK